MDTTELIQIILQADEYNKDFKELSCKEIKDDYTGYCLNAESKLKGISFHINSEDDKLIYSFADAVSWLRPFKDSLEILNIGYFEEISSLDPLAELKELKWIDLYGNTINNAQGFSKLTKLEYLNLDHFETISNLKLPDSLISLSLNYTDEVNLDSLKHLPKLETLRIINNFRKPLNFKILEKLLYLKSLSIGFKQFEVLDTEFLNRLETLIVTDIFIENTAFVEKFKKFALITQPQFLSLYIELDNNPKITAETILDILQNNQNFRKLHLWTSGYFMENKLVWHNIEKISRLKSLRFLEISSMPITGISSIGELKNLEHLALENFVFMLETDKKLIKPDYDFSFVAGLNNLETLKLDGVGLKDLSQLGYHPETKKLVISHNLKIKNLDLLPELFPNIEKLNLHSLEIETIEPLTRLQNLKYVDLTFTEIKDSSAIDSLKDVKVNLICSNVEPC